MLKKLYILFSLLFFLNVTGQNNRDKFIMDSIEPYISDINLQKDRYFSIKKAIQKLESEFGYEPEFKYRLINQSFIFNDIDFFKKELTILTETYGFDMTYMSENESYFESISNGNLKEWFKQMFLEKHFIWLKNNFEKQIDLRKLNEIRLKDQLVNNYAAKIVQNCNLDSIQKSQELKQLNKFFLSNVTELYTISLKWSVYPTAKSFALIQNNFGVAEFHNNQSIENFDKFWSMFFPFYKKAYLDNQITYMNFRNHDNFSYLHYGIQEFGLISINDVPTEYRKNNNEIPVKDLEFMKKIKKEFKW